MGHPRVGTLRGETSVCPGLTQKEHDWDGPVVLYPDLNTTPLQTPSDSYSEMEKGYEQVITVAQ